MAAKIRRKSYIMATVSECLLASEYDKRTPKEKRKRAFQIRTNEKTNGARI